MFTRLATIAAVLLLLAPAIPAAAGPYGSADEARVLAERAAQLIRDIGIDRARPLLIDVDGPFVDRDLYVFVIDRAGFVHAHPDRRAIGGNTLATRDPNGKAFIREMVARARDAGSGFWVEYVWLHPRLGTYATKRAWVVPVGDLLVACGAYIGEAT